MHKFDDYGKSNISMLKCELVEYGTYCKTYRCGVFEANCRQEGCPHCSFFKSNYNELDQEKINRVILSQLDDGLFEGDCA